MFPLGRTTSHALASRTITAATVTSSLVRCPQSVTSIRYVVPGASLPGRRTYLNARYSTSIAIPSGSDLDYVEIAPLPTVPTVRSTLSFGVRRSSRNITQFNLRMTTRPFPSWGITTADLAPMKGGDSGCSTRRPIKAAFLAPTMIMDLTTEVTELRGRVMTESQPSSMQSSQFSVTRYSNAV
jgi:hypothetical protein